MITRLFKILVPTSVIIFLGCQGNIDDNSTPPKNDTLTMYYDSGKIKSIEILRNKRKNGMAKYYFANGKISGQFHYENGVKKGDYKTYYENGIVRSEGFLLNDTTPDGDCKIYDVEGRLLETNKYNDGKKIN